MYMLLRPQLSLGDGEVHVWHLLAEQVHDPRVHHALEELLSPDERRRMERFAHPRDRTLFLLSRGLMRSVLAAYLGCGCRDMTFTSNPFGKPILGGPAAMHFNLSHSRGAIALAVSGRDVGVDVEERERRVDFLGLAQRYFAATE